MSLFKKAANPIFTTHEHSNHPAESVKSLSEDKFWSTIGKIRWVDVSENKMNIAVTKSILSANLSTSELSEFKNRVRETMNELKKYMKKCGYSNLNDEFLSHIVGKGKLFYYNVLDDPEFATYLLAGDTQNFWTVLEK